MRLSQTSATITSLALLLCCGSVAPPATAQEQDSWQEIAIVAPLQTVEAETPRRSYSAVFQNEARVFPDGGASGFLTLIGSDGGPGHAGGANLTFTDGSVRFRPDGTVARVRLRGLSAGGEPVVVFILPVEDCLIYTTIGTDVHAIWEAQGRLTLIR